MSGTKNRGNRTIDETLANTLPNIFAGIGVEAVS
jgi:hypothetical protein